MAGEYGASLRLQFPRNSLGNKRFLVTSEIALASAGEHQNDAEPAAGKSGHWIEFQGAFEFYLDVFQASLEGMTGTVINPATFSSSFLLRFNLRATRSSMVKAILLLKRKARRDSTENLPLRIDIQIQRSYRFLFRFLLLRAELCLFPDPQPCP